MWNYSTYRIILSWVFIGHWAFVSQPNHMCQFLFGKIWNFVLELIFICFFLWLQLLSLRGLIPAHSPQSSVPARVTSIAGHSHRKPKRAKSLFTAVVRVTTTVSLHQRIVRGDVRAYRDQLRVSNHKRPSENRGSNRIAFRKRNPNNFKSSVLQKNSQNFENWLSFFIWNLS